MEDDHHLLRYVAVPAIALLISATALPAFAVEGPITKPGAHFVDPTIERFEVAVKNRGFMVFARLDHAAAVSVGLKMPWATVVVFGNPRVGTPVFIKTPTVAIDLPPKAIGRENSNGKVLFEV